MNQPPNEYEATGYRFIDNVYSTAPQVGDTLGNSYAWDEDQITDDEKTGTCCFETREQIEDYAKYSKGTGWIVEIAGSHNGSGFDFAGEILIGDAIVLAVEVW